jgi:hypothetical protein
MTGSQAPHTQKVDHDQTTLIELQTLLQEVAQIPVLSACAQHFGSAVQKQDGGGLVIA